MRHSSAGSRFLPFVDHMVLAKRMHRLDAFSIRFFCQGPPLPSAVDCRKSTISTQPRPYPPQHGIVFYSSRIVNTQYHPIGDSNCTTLTALAQHVECPPQLSLALSFALSGMLFLTSPSRELRDTLNCRMRAWWCLTVAVSRGSGAINPRSRMDPALLTPE
jgi:hypothetical protein